jgi:hypothetical protein
LRGYLVVQDIDCRCGFADNPAVHYKSDGNRPCSRGVQIHSKSVLRPALADQAPDVPLVNRVDRGRSHRSECVNTGHSGQRFRLDFEVAARGS